MAILALAYIAVLRQLNASRRLQLRITESCPIEPGEVLLGLVGTDDLRSSWRLHYQQNLLDARGRVISTLKSTTRPKIFEMASIRLL